jgi:transcriptional regulator with XRE-family HTH domain
MALRLEWGELAARLGMSRAMLDFLRKGQRKPSFRTLDSIEAAEREAGLTPPPAVVRETPEPYAARPENDSISAAIARIEAKTEDLTAEFRALREALKRVIK